MRIRYILWNLIGLGLPLLMAVFAIPGLLTRIGPERFGLLALAWGLIGYAGMRWIWALVVQRRSA